MSVDPQENFTSGESPNTLFEQNVKGARKVSNYLIGLMLAIGGVGFLLASVSSFLGKDLLPLGHPSTLIFVPQGLVMGLYGIAAALLAIYLWRLISVNFGSGFNRFNKNSGLLVITRQGFFKEITVEVPLKDINAVKLDVREGFNSKRRITLRIKGTKDLPISQVGAPKPLIELEKEAAQLSRFLGVGLEGI
tara:strand:- start:672 stop:1247 length:576 start_codon:yes stop_codon:yes gene_type:complete